MRSSSEKMHKITDEGPPMRICSRNGDDEDSLMRICSKNDEKPMETPPDADEKPTRTTSNANERSEALKE